MRDHNGNKVTHLVCVILAIAPGIFFYFSFYITIQILIVNLLGKALWIFIYWVPFCDGEIWRGQMRSNESWKGKIINFDTPLKISKFKIKPIIEKPANILVKTKTSPTMVQLIKKEFHRNTSREYGKYRNRTLSI